MRRRSPILSQNAISKERINYNFYSNKRWDDLSNYHLTIDSSEFDIDEVAEIIITAIGKIKPPAKK